MIYFLSSLVSAAVILLLYFIVALWSKDIRWIWKVKIKLAVLLIMLAGAVAAVIEPWVYHLIQFSLNYL